MSRPLACERAEIVAGAIALGEARDDERHAYRAHLATCRRCLEELGGERDIERTMAAVAAARAEECWSPDVRELVTRPRAGRRAWRWGAATLAAAVALAVLAVGTQRPPIHRSAALPAPSSVAQSALAALGTQAMPPRVHHAESLQFRGALLRSRAVTLRLILNAQDRPVRCRMAQPRRAALERALCAAALHAR